MKSEEFKLIFLPLTDKLFKVARRFTDNDDDAKDIIQDAYLKLWEIRDKLDEIDNCEAFSVRLVRNLSLDFLKSARVKNNIGITAEEVIIDSSDEINDNNPLSEMIERENENVIISLIERLPEQQKEVMKLRHYSECSMEEIVDLTGISATNVRTILSRARKKIKGQFEKIFDYESR